jgi:hypothetical protein
MTQRKITVIPIDHQYRLAADEHGWMIQVQRGRNGKKEWESRWYFTGIEGAIGWLGEMLVRVSGTQTLPEALQEVDRIATRLSQALTPKIDVDLSAHKGGGNGE